MADGTVGVRQAASPDRLIDNEVLDVNGETVYRQRVQDPEVIALLTSVKAAVEGTLDAAVSGTVALDAATLSALETVNVVVSNAITATVTGEVSLSAATLSALENVTATISGAVALDSATLTALEAITATIANWPSDFPDATAHSKLDGILAELQQKLEAGQAVALDSVTLAALEAITVSVTGTVDTGLTQPLTDAELRATPVPISDGGSSITVDDATSRDLTHVVATVTDAGDTTIYTPTSGNAVRLHWIYALVDPGDTTSSPLIRIYLGAEEKYRVFALSKRQVVTGPTDGALKINLSELSTVAVTALIEEVTL